MLGPIDTILWNGRAGQTVDLPRTEAPTPVVAPTPTRAVAGVPFSSRAIQEMLAAEATAEQEAAARALLGEMPEESRKLLLRYCTTSPVLFAAVRVGDWDVVLKLASKPLADEDEDAVRRELHAWLTQRLESPATA
jgi:hypothetical protein